MMGFTTAPVMMILMVLLVIKVEKRSSGLIAVLEHGLCSIPFYVLYLVVLEVGLLNFFLSNFFVSLFLV